MPVTLRRPSCPVLSVAAIAAFGATFGPIIMVLVLLLILLALLILILLLGFALAYATPIANTVCGIWQWLVSKCKATWQLQTKQTICYDRNSFRFDPVSDLPGELSSMCLSFLDVCSLLYTVRDVNNAWCNAIDGGLPALWRDVRVFEHTLFDDTDLKEMVRSSRGAIHTLVLRPTLYSGISTRRLKAAFRSLRDLRVLSIGPGAFHIGPRDHRTFGQILSHIPLLEQLSIDAHNHLIMFPPLPFLTSLTCRCCSSLKGLHNLPSLTRLDMGHCYVKANDAWPHTLVDIFIFDHKEFEPRLLDRIASLHQPTSIQTDWSFAHKPPHNTLFKPPYDQLAFLSSFSTLRRLTVVSPDSGSSDINHASTTGTISPDVIFNVLGSVTSLVSLELNIENATDQHLRCVSLRSNLQELSLTFTPFLTNATLRLICTSLPSLTKLFLQECHHITDFSYINMCSSLQELHIDHLSRCPASLKQLRQITSLPKLVSLSLRICVFEKYDAFSYICDIPNIREITLSFHDAFTVPVIMVEIWPFLLPTCIGSRLNRLRQRLFECLAHMPTLTHVSLPNMLFLRKDEALLSASLPRLSSLQFDCA